jgi:hypothetical protein
VNQHLIVRNRLPIGTVVAYHGSLVEQWGTYTVASSNAGVRDDGTAGHVLFPTNRDGVVLRGVGASSCTVLPVD